MAIEEPGALLARSGCGREEILQRLVTMLILGLYPRWDSRTPPTHDGLRFLDMLDELAYGESGGLDGAVFIDEFKLPARPVDNESAWPDYAVLTDDRLWIIELKTERGSHRPTQLPWYVELARHHYPDHRLDLTYLTGSFTYPPVEMPAGSRYAHLAWADVLPLVSAVWGPADPAGAAVEQRVVADIDSIVRSIGVSWESWKAARLADAPSIEGRAATAAPAVAALREEEPAGADDPVVTAVGLAKLTGDDRRQRALDFAAGSLWDLAALRDLVNADIRATAAAGSGLGLVKAWVWRSESSGGSPLTGAGADTGYELRLSCDRPPA
jgi:hypothetical protein